MLRELLHQKELEISKLGEKAERHVDGLSVRLRQHVLDVQQAFFEKVMTSVGKVGELYYDADKEKTEKK